MEKSNRKAPIVFYVGIILLCVCLTSVHLVGGLYARYSTSYSAGDSARVAAAVITAEILPYKTVEEIDVALGQEYQVQLTVTSSDESDRVSEVAWDYVIYIETPVEPQLSISIVGMDLVEDESTSTLKVFRSQSPLPAGGESKTHIITFAGDMNIVGVHKDVPYTIRFKAEQAD